jgi:maltose-binding protein MalE
MPKSKNAHVIRANVSSASQHIAMARQYMFDATANMTDNERIDTTDIVALLLDAQVLTSILFNETYKDVPKT